MRTFIYWILGMLALVVVGCGSQNGSRQMQQDGGNHAHGDADDTEREASFAKLSPEDRALAEAQGYCAVTSEPLGSMGPPLKVVVNDEAVFVCCKGCERGAKSNPEKTLAKVAELKAKVKAENNP
jgi:hypothetical protein